MVGAIISRTPNYGFGKVRFDMPGWHGVEHDNWSLADALLASIGSIPGSRGVWQNSTAYVNGDRVADADGGGLYRCLVSHTSASSGSFADDRAAHPSYWSVITQVPIDRGTWATATSYSTQDIVRYTNAYYYCVIAHTSGVFATDLASGRWVLIFDLQDAYDQAAAAAASASAAAGSASAAATSAGAASSSASAASGSASAAAGSASAAAGSASAASTSASNASTSATNANSAKVAAQAAQAAAEGVYDTFDDRYLGAKASDPTTDNDGNTLLVGAEYWNIPFAVRRTWDGTTWKTLVGGSIMSDTPPANPQNGQKWIRTTDMREFNWYVDGTSSQWVEALQNDAQRPSSDNNDYIMRNGVWVKASTQLIASGSWTSSIDIALPSEYSSYRLRLFNLYNSTAGSFFNLQCRVAGTWFNSSTNYKWVNGYASNAGVNKWDDTSGSAAIVIGASSLDLGVAIGHEFEIMLTPGNANASFGATWYGGSLGISAVYGGGHLAAAFGRATDIRFNAVNRGYYELFGNRG